MEKKSVLIIGLSTYVELAIIRSLGRHGIKIYGVGNKKIDICFFSRYLTKGYIFPKFEEEEEFIEFIEKILKKHEIDYVIAVFENILVTLNNYRGRIEKISRLLIPPENILDTALDKSKTLELANRLNIPIPETIIINEIKELNYCKDLIFPVVVKPSSRKYDNPLHDKMNFRRNYIHNFYALRDFLNKFKPYRFFPVMIQEYCKGEEIGFPVLMNNGKSIACMQYKVLRTCPFNGGTPTYREAVKIDPVLREQSIRLLKAMKWKGVAELDYITDNRDGKIKLLEVNGRFWGSLPLSIGVGIDFPYLLYRCDENSDDIEVLDYSVGARYRNLYLDTGRLSEIFFRRISDKEPDQMPSKPIALLEYLKSFYPSVRYDSGGLDDPLPGILYFTASVIALFSGVKLPVRVSLENEPKKYV